MIAAAVQRDVDGIPKGSHGVSVAPIGQRRWARARARGRLFSAARTRFSRSPEDRNETVEGGEGGHVHRRDPRAADGHPRTQAQARRPLRGGKDLPHTPKVRLTAETDAFYDVVTPLNKEAI